MHLPLARAAIAANVPVWLYGEAGSGKSTAGEQVAQQLDMPFRSISFGPGSSKADLMGYRDATGEYHSTGYREVYENGGVFLFDEIDNANPAVVTMLNNGIANKHGEFPDGYVPKHPDARFIASANTIGKGATADYVGRSPIDAATIDRFAFVRMDTSEDLEEALVLGVDMQQQEAVDIAEGGIPDNMEWLATVRAFRGAAAEIGIRAIIGQRASLHGKNLIEQGVGRRWLQEMLIYKGMKNNDRDKLQHTANQRVQEEYDKLQRKYKGDASRPVSVPRAVSTGSARPVVRLGSIKLSSEAPGENSVEYSAGDPEWFRKVDDYDLTQMSAEELDDARTAAIYCDGEFSQADYLRGEGNPERQGGFDAMVAVSWQAAKQHQVDIFDDFYPAKADIEEARKRGQKLTAASIVTKGAEVAAQIEKLKKDGDDLTTTLWGEEQAATIARINKYYHLFHLIGYKPEDNGPEDMPKHIRRFNEVAYKYVQEFVSIYNFTPSVLIMASYLVQHPEFDVEQLKLLETE